jgi:hypothetical protein
MADIKSCPDCDTDEHVIITEKKEQVCLKCGLVVDETCLVHSYTKPQINYKTPYFRQPREYDTIFHDLMDSLDDNNIIRFNYTPKGSKNYENDGHYDPYKTPTRNKDFKLFLSYLDDAPQIPLYLNPSFFKGHHELSRHGATGNLIDGV